MSIIVCDMKVCPINSIQNSSLTLRVLVLKLMLPETNIFYFKFSSFLVITKGTLNKDNIILHICPH